MVKLEQATRRDSGLALLFERTARSIYDKRAPTDIHPGQWSALRYFARANRNVRTVAGLARYLGVTRGPASRAAAALVKKGLLRADENDRDRRAPILTLTEEGQDLLSEDPILRLARAISLLDEPSKANLAASLESLHQSLEI